MALPMRSTDFRSVVEPILNETFDGIYDQRADEWKMLFREFRDECSCGIRIVMKDVRDATAKILDSTTLADVLKRVEAVVQGKEGLHYAI